MITTNLDADLEIALSKIRILARLCELLESRERRLSDAENRNEVQSAKFHKRHRQLEAAKLIELTANNDREFWSSNRLTTPDVFFIDL